MIDDEFAQAPNHVLLDWPRSFFSLFATMTNDAIGLSYYTILARCFTQPHAGAVLIVLNEDHAGGLEGGDYPFASLGRRSFRPKPRVLLRVGEALALDWRDVDLSRTHAAFLDTKNDDRRGMPLHPRALAALANLLHRAGKVFRRPDKQLYEPKDGEGGQIKTAFKGGLSAGRNSPEVEGTLGQIDGEVHLVQNGQDVDRLAIGPNTPIAYVTQTTLSVDDTRDVIAALHCRFSDIHGPETRNICYATQHRQSAVRELAQVADVIVVVGAHNSSNSTRLREVGEQAGLPSYLVADGGEIDPEWFRGVNVVGVTAGASALKFSSTTWCKL